MRNLLLIALMAWTCLSSAQSNLIITGVVDGPLPGGVPKAVELYALEAIPDLSIYALGSANNGNGSSGIESTLPSITLNQGDFIYVTTAAGAGDFLDFFGFPPTLADQGSALFINGDDALELYQNGSIVDIFGDPNVDGTGQPWEYTDGWAYRQSTTGPDGPTFQQGNWNYSGPDALDGVGINDTSANAFPLGSYSQIVLDGGASNIYLPGICYQDNSTGFGDNTDASDTLSTGSELNGAHAVIDGNTLYLMLTGNLQTNFNKLDIFIDCLPGGQNMLSGDNPDVDFNGLNRMGIDTSMMGGSGMTFDDGFESDYFYTFTNGIGGGGAYEIFANTAQTIGPAGVGMFLGGGPGRIQSLANGHGVAIDNSNTAGVTDMMANNPQGVTTGLEIAIPLSEIGNPVGEIKTIAFINGGSHDFVSNQVLCPTGPGQANLGEPRNLDFGAVPGDQFFTLCSGVDGGTVSTEGGSFEEIVCVNDGIPDFISFDSSTTSMVNYTYVVTDGDGVILGLPGVDSVDFEGAGVGTCLLWGLSYLGNITAMAGDTATQVALSDSCFDLSSNFITVIRDTAEAGMVLTESGMDTAFVCYNDPSQGVIAFDSIGASNLNYAYVITDTATRILGVSATGVVDFTNAGPGECYVWGLSYTGELTVGLGDTVATAGSLSDGCFDLSDEFVSVFRDSVSGGQVLASADTIFVSLLDTLSDVIRFDSINAFGPNFNYVVTDTATEILGLPPGDMVDFAGAGAGICYVWGLSYTGNVTVGIGDTAATSQLSDQCFDLSDNFIVVVRTAVDAGRVQTEAGEDSVYVCYNDPMDDGIVSFDSITAANFEYAYVITDPSTRILGVNTTGIIDFNAAGPGVCWVWGLSYTGNLLVSPGDTVATAGDLTDGDFDLSDEFVRVFRDSVSGGEVLASADSIFLDLNDNLSNVVSFDSAGAVGGSFTYVVTDTATKILGLPPGDMVDFSGAGPGICYVWGLSFTGNILVGLNDTAAGAVLSDGCFDLSDEFIVVVREDVVSNEALAFSQLRVYPVPAEDKLTISFEKRSLRGEETEIKVFDYAGRVVLKSGTRSSSQQLDISALSKGIYMLQLRNADRVSNVRFVKE